MEEVAAMISSYNALPGPITEPERAGIMADRLQAMAIWATNTETNALVAVTVPKLESGNA
ncbi:MAG: hypothetical protein ABIT61_08515 [Steroidobacteraceae bacterium]